MYEDVKIKESLLDSDGITFKPVLGSAYILELDGLVEYQMSQSYSEVVFGYWGRAEDPETGLTNLCIYPPRGNYYENNPECVGYYRGRVTYDGEEYDSWYWDNWTNTIIYTDIITYIEVKVNPFFDFMKYCPKLDILYRNKLETLHSTDAINQLGCNSDVTMPINAGSYTRTTYTYNGVTYNLYRMDGYDGDGVEKGLNCTSVGSYAFYLGTTDLGSTPAIFTPFEYRGVNFCKLNIISSYIYPSSHNGSTSGNYGTHWKNMLLPEFIFTTEGSDGYGQVNILKLYGPYEYDIYTERAIIVWDKKVNVVKPKYLLIYYDTLSNIPSNIGSGSYGQPLKKIIEIK